MPPASMSVQSVIALYACAVMLVLLVRDSDACIRQAPPELEYCDPSPVRDKIVHAGAACPIPYDAVSTQ